MKAALDLQLVMSSGGGLIISAKGRTAIDLQEIVVAGRIRTQHLWYGTLTS